MLRNLVYRKCGFEFLIRLKSTRGESQKLVTAVFSPNDSNVGFGNSEFSSEEADNRLVGFSPFRRGGDLDYELVVLESVHGGSSRTCDGFDRYFLFFRFLHFPFYPTEL